MAAAWLEPQKLDFLIIAEIVKARNFSNKKIFVIKPKPHKVRDKSHNVEIAVLPKALNNVFKSSINHPDKNVESS